MIIFSIALVLVLALSHVKGDTDGDTFSLYPMTYFYYTNTKVSADVTFDGKNVVADFLNGTKVTEGINSDYTNKYIKGTKALLRNLEDNSDVAFKKEAVTINSGTDATGGEFILLKDVNVYVTDGGQISKSIIDASDNLDHMFFNNANDSDPVKERFCSKIPNWTKQREFVINLTPIEGDEIMDPVKEKRLKDIVKIFKLFYPCDNLTITCPTGICYIGLINDDEKYTTKKAVQLMGNPSTPTNDGSYYKEICSTTYNRAIPTNNIIVRNLTINGNVKFLTISPNYVPVIETSTGSYNIYDSDITGLNEENYGFIVKRANGDGSKKINWETPIISDQGASYCYNIPASGEEIISTIPDAIYDAYSEDKDYYNHDIYYRTGTIENKKIAKFYKFLSDNKYEPIDGYMEYSSTFNEYNPFLNYGAEQGGIYNDGIDDENINWESKTLISIKYLLCYTRNDRMDVTKGTNSSSSEDFQRTYEGTVGFGESLTVSENSKLITDDYTYVYPSDILSQVLSYVFFCTGDENEVNLTSETDMVGECIIPIENQEKAVYNITTSYVVNIGEGAEFRANTGDDVVYELGATANNAAEEYQCYIKSTNVANKNVTINSFTTSILDLTVATLPWAKTNIYSRYLNLSPGSSFKSINIKEPKQKAAIESNDASSPYFKIGSIENSRKTILNSNLYLLLTTTSDLTEKLTGNVAIQQTVTDRVTIEKRSMDCENGYKVGNKDKCVSAPVIGSEKTIFEFGTDDNNKTFFNIESNVKATFDYPRRMNVDSVVIAGLLLFTSGVNSYKPNQMNISTSTKITETGKIITQSKNLNVHCSFDNEINNIKNTIGGSSFGCGSYKGGKKNECPEELQYCTYPKKTRIEAIEALNSSNSGISINYFVGVPGNVIYKKQDNNVQSNAGGGIIIQTCELTVNGEINADGQDASNGSSAGSGGSIRIDDSCADSKKFTIAGNGHLSAHGGKASSEYGAGSGGIVFVMSTKKEIDMSNSLTIDLSGGKGDGSISDADDGYYHNIPLCGYYRPWTISDPKHPGQCSISTIPIAIISIVSIIIFAYIVYCIAIAIRNYVKRNVDLPLSYNPFRMRKNQISSALVNGRTLNIVALASKEGWLIDPAELTIGEFLGKGGNASVYKGVYRGSMVAVKKIAIDAQNEKVLADLTRETLLMSRLRHPHCLAFYGAYFTDAEATLVIELAPWGDLRKLINAFYAKFSVPNNKYVIHILKLMQQILSALQHLHTQTPPVVHRDLKPGNILLRNKDSAVLADFGISRALDKNSANSTICGTPAYAAPESANNKLSVKYDIYCFGTIIWEALTGKKPFSDIANPLRIMAELQSRGAPSDLTEEVWKKYPDIKELVRKCWIKNPEERPDVQEVAKMMHELYAKYNAMQSESKPSGATPASPVTPNQN